MTFWGKAARKAKRFFVFFVPRGNQNKMADVRFSVCFTTNKLPEITDVVLNERP